MRSSRRCIWLISGFSAAWIFYQTSKSILIRKSFNQFFQKALKILSLVIMDLRYLRTHVKTAKYLIHIYMHFLNILNTIKLNRHLIRIYHQFKSDSHQSLCFGLLRILINAMERRVADSQKKNSQIKLPVINHRKGDSSRVLSNTMPDNCKTRPSSMHKVEDLQKKLFQKLQTYQNPSRKTLKRGTKKKVEGENTVQPHIEGFQRIQKLMPGLFTKLVEVKKSVNLQPPTQKQPQLLTSQSKMGKKISSAQHKNRKIQHKQSSIEKQQKQVDNEIEMSRQEFQQVYREYSRSEQLAPETSGKQLAAMGQNLMMCEKQIEKLTKSMQGLIRQIGIECLVDFQEEQEQTT